MNFKPVNIYDYSHGCIYIFYKYYKYSYFLKYLKHLFRVKNENPA